MTRRDRIVIGVVVAIAAIGAYWFLLLAPKREEASTLGTQIAEQQQELDGLRGQIAAGRDAEASYDGNYATVARLGAAVPEDDDVASLVHQLEAVADDSRVDFRAVRVAEGGGPSSESADASEADAAALPPGATVGPAELPVMPFSFTFEGGFFKLNDFFRHLESFVGTEDGRIDVGGRLLTIDGIRLTAGRGGFPQVEAQLAATAYLLPEEEGLTDGATPQAPRQGGPQPVRDDEGAGGPPTATVGPNR